MADNKGSSSNPAQGLVSHLDRNRDLQQDRTVASSSSSSGASFRSRPQNQSAAPAEANFANFTAATQLGALPLRPAHQQPTLSTQFRPELGTTWLHEFNLSSEREVQDPTIMSSFMRRAVRGAANQNAANTTSNPAPGTFNRVNPFSGSPSYQLLPPHLRPSGFNAGGVPASYYTPGPGQSQQPMGNVAGATAASGQYNVYPEQVLADNPGMAMEAAFAAYDQDFQNEMDSWMDTHGPEDREDHVQKMEEVLAADQQGGVQRDEQRDEIHAPIVGRTDLGPSINPAVPGSNIDTYEQEKKDFDVTAGVEEPRNEARKERALNNDVVGDAELREHAVKILGTLASEGSAETKKKLASSSFRGLMEAIASGKAVVHEERFIDPTSGAMIDDWEALGDGNIQDYGESKPQGEGETGGKGKGKMKSSEEQAREKKGKDGGAPASA